MGILNLLEAMVYGTAVGGAALALHIQNKRRLKNPPRAAEPYPVDFCEEHGVWPRTACARCARRRAERDFSHVAQCPRCGLAEIHPVDRWVTNPRGKIVGAVRRCLRCYLTWSQQ